MSRKISGVKGMRDLWGEEMELFSFIERTCREVMRRFGYQEIRTPMLEETSLFVRGVGETTDIVGKEMYTFDDKAGRSLTLRPEGTAPCVRAYLEHAVHNLEPVTHWFYMGPMFRYERMKTGRYRQFFQVGAEAYGAASPAQDVELMDLSRRILEGLGLSGVRLHVSSLGDSACRPAYQEKLRAHLAARQDELCAECKVRLERNPLRVLDCKNERCQEITRDAPVLLDMLCDDCRAHFDAVQRQLRALGISYEVDARIVRGLDYYTRTAFELIASDPVLGTASAVGGGGRYDRLVEMLGGPSVPAVGWALGVDRLALLLSKRGRPEEAPPDLFVASAGEGVLEAVLAKISAWRGAGLRVEMDPRGGSLKSQMKRADKSGARFALVLGDDEVASCRGKLKPMSGGEAVEVSLDEVAAHLRATPP